MDISYVVISAKGNVYYEAASHEDAMFNCPDRKPGYRTAIVDWDTKVAYNYRLNDGVLELLEKIIAVQVML